MALLVKFNMVSEHLEIISALKGYELECSEWSIAASQKRMGLSPLHNKNADPETCSWRT